MRQLFAIIILIILFALNSFATDYYCSKVDGSDAYNGLYPTFQSGSDGPWLTITKANNTLTAGDTVYLVAGTYQDNDGGAIIKPDNSGTSGNPITYTNYNGGTVILKGVVEGTHIDGQDYITIDGLQFKEADQTGVMQMAARIKGDSNYCIIQNCLVENMNNESAVYWNKGILLRSETSYCQILNNTVQYLGWIWDGTNPGDGIWIEGDHHIIAGNETHYCGHNGIRIDGDAHIVKNNELHGEWCRVIAINDSDTTHRSVVEDNEFYNTNQSIDFGPFASCQIQASNVIWRRNRHHVGEGNGIMMLSSTAVNADYPRIYNNIIYGYGTLQDGDWNHGLNCVENNSDDTMHFCDYRNNIFYNNDADGTHYWAFAEAADHNRDYNHWDGAGTEDSHGTNYTTGDPKFSNPAGGVFTLQSDSPCIDTGTWLTLTSGSGSGTSMVVDDAKFFTDGFGLQTGDLIQLDGQVTTSEVTAINYGTNTLTLGTSLTWDDNQGVALAYSGSAPDKGVYEYTGDVGTGIGKVGQGRVIKIGSGRILKIKKEERPWN